MLSSNLHRVGYVVKRYPRYSETFIVNEILAHEKAGLDLDIFALRAPVDSHFQPAIARVRACVTYLDDRGKMADFWQALQAAAEVLPNCAEDALSFRGEDAGALYQGIQLAAAVRRRGISHLHAHFATSAATVARIAARLANITYSLTAHAKDIFHESVNLAELGAKLRDASSTITVSDFNTDYLRRTCGVAADRVVRIYNGLDLDLFPYKEPGKRPPRILGVGRLVEKKGFGYLIDACAILNARGVAFDCRIVGAGELEAQLQDRIERYGLADCVQLMGPKSQSELVDILHEASVFAAPCTIGKDGNRDGLPTVLLESMALGTPCIATDVTGIPEILHHESNGLLVARDNPHMLADAIARLLNDSMLRVRLAEQARAMIEAHFDIHRNAAMIRSHFTPPVSSGDVLPAAHLQIWNAL